MAYLAAVLGQIEGDDKFVPVTNRRDQLAVFQDQAPSLSRRTSVRELVLRGLLPSPSESIDPRRLADFKAQHGRDLTDFRREVENRVAEWYSH